MYLDHTDAQIKAEAAWLILATRQLEEIGISKQQLKQWVKDKQKKVDRMARAVEASSCT